MMRLAKLYQWIVPETLRLTYITMTEVSPGAWKLDNTPYVTFVGHRLTRLWPEGVELLRATGYRPLAKDIRTLTTIYVRPLPLWLFYRVINAIGLAFWKTLGGLYDVGLFHFDAQDGVRARLRDVRPGPSAEARLIYRNWVGRMVQKVRRFVWRIKE